MGLVRVPLVHSTINKKSKHMTPEQQQSIVKTFSSICNTENEVIEGCGYEVNEITFEELLERVEGVFEIIKVEGSVEFLTD